MESLALDHQLQLANLQRSTRRQFLQNCTTGLGAMWLAIQAGQTAQGSAAAPRELPHLRDFHATMLHMLGIDFRRHSHYFQGLHQKLTGVKPAQVIHDVIA